MIKIVQYSGYNLPFNYCEFMVDNYEDIKNLPTNINPTEQFNICSVGSIAYFIENEQINMYILTPKNTWVKFI